MMSETGAVLGLLMAGYIAGAFILANYLLNKEARAARRKVKKVTAPGGNKGCAPSRETTLDA